jgi:hypothetical protein
MTGRALEKRVGQKAKVKVRDKQRLKREEPEEA